MLGAVRDGSADLAIANISITAMRETQMDFSQPIFEAGLQIMVPSDAVRRPSLLQALLSTELFIAIGLAFAILAGRRHADVGVRAARAALFRPQAERGVVPILLVGAESGREWRV